MSEHAACPCTTGAPPLSSPVLADRAADVVDSSSLRFLTASALETRREEEERQKREEQEELNSLRAVPVERRTHQQVKRITYLLLNRGAKRKRKKLPRPSSSRGPAHRRQRQWHFHCWLRWFYAYAVSSSLVGRPKLLDTMDGLDQNDSIHCARRRLWLRHMQSWFCWYCILRCVPSCYRLAPDAWSWPVCTIRTVVTAVACARLVSRMFCTSRCVPPVFFVGRPAARLASWPASTRGTVMCRDGHQHPCRGAEAVSLGPDCSENHSDSPAVVLGQGDR